MCPASDIRSRESTPDGEDLVSKDDGDYNRDAMQVNGLDGRFPANIHLRLREMGEEVLALGKLSCPMVMNTLLFYSRMIISMLFLSRTGKVELAGGSLAIGFVNITGLSLLKGLTIGMDPICGQAYGAKRWSVISQTCQRTVILLLLVSIPVSFLWLNVEPILLRLGQDPEITRFAKVYMAFCIPELLAQAVLQPTRSFLKTQGLTTPLIVSAIVACILHTPINYFFAVYLRLGAKGVALALACNTMNVNIGLLMYIFFSESSLKPWHGLTVQSLFQGWWPLLSLAVPSLISVCLEWWWYELMLFLCGLLSNPKASVAATGILIQIAGLIYVFPFSLGSALTTRVGQTLGAGQPHRAQWTAITGITLAFTYALTACILTNVLTSAWGRMYTDEPRILDLISVGLPILGFCELANSPQTAACGVLTGTARPKDGARINLCSFYFVGLPVALLLTFKLKMGFQGMWFGLLAAQISCMSMMLYTLIRTDWRHQAKRAKDLTSSVENRDDRDDLESHLLSTDQ